MKILQRADSFPMSGDALHEHQQKITEESKQDPPHGDSEDPYLRRALEGIDLKHEQKKLLLQLGIEMRRNAGRGRIKYLGFWGFASVSQRNAVLRCMRYALKPRIIHFAQTSESRFEGFVATKLYDKQEERLADFCDACGYGLGFHEIDGWLDDMMISCITRVVEGTDYFGNWLSKGVRHTRFAFQRRSFEIAERQRRQHVLSVTGMPFSPGNMLATHYRAENTALEARDLANELRAMIHNQTSNHLALVRANNIIQQSDLGDFNVRSSLAQLLHQCLSRFHVPRTSLSAMPLRHPQTSSSPLQPHSPNVEWHLPAERAPTPLPSQRAPTPPPPSPPVSYFPSSLSPTASTSPTSSTTVLWMAQVD